jgi:hypothetical protein
MLDNVSVRACACGETLVVIFDGRASTDRAEPVQHVLCENANGGLGAKLNHT